MRETPAASLFVFSCLCPVSTSYGFFESCHVRPPWGSSSWAEYVTNMWGVGHEFVGFTSRIWRSRICRGNRGLGRGNASILRLGFPALVARRVQGFCPLVCAVGFAPAPGMSAFGGKADARSTTQKSPLIAITGHAGTIPKAWIFRSLVVSLLGQGDRSWNAGLQQF